MRALVALVVGLAFGVGCSGSNGSSTSSSSGTSASSGSSGTGTNGSGASSSTSTIGSGTHSASSSSGTSTGGASSSTSSGGASSSGAAAQSLIGTWDLITTPVGASSATSTVVIGQDAISITAPGFTLTASRSGNVLTFTEPGSTVLTGTETAAAFTAGIVPFTLGGSWAIQGGPSGGSSTVGCTLQMGGSEIDATCNNLNPTSAWFTFTTAKGADAASSFGDFGGAWTNTWIWGAPDGGGISCGLDFAGNDVTSCDGGMASGDGSGTPISGITFTYDGANTISGSAQGWAEFSATRQ
jgi:hypothetical protein